MGTFIANLSNFCPQTKNLSPPGPATSASLPKKFAPIHIFVIWFTLPLIFDSFRHIWLYQCTALPAMYQCTTPPPLSNEQVPATPDWGGGGVVHPPTIEMRCCYRSLALWCWTLSPQTVPVFLGGWCAQLHAPIILMLCVFNCISGPKLI